MDMDRDFASVPVVWEPKEDSGMLTKKFMKKIEDKYNVKLLDYWDLHKWSIKNPENFWHELWHLSGIIYSELYHQVIDLSVPIGEFQEWYAGSKMNYAENLLKYRDNKEALAIAGEDRETKRVTYAEMYEEVKLYAAALRKLGVKKNDVVSCFMSNREEAIFAMIATTSIGAIWVGVLPLMGPQAVLNRLSQVRPKILFTVDRFPHNREEINMLPKLKEIADGLTSLEKVLIVASKPESTSKDISGIRNSCFLHDFLKTGEDSDGSVPEMVFEQVPFSHPVYISYTSGTTGLPKVLYHSSAILLGCYRDFRLHSNDENRNDCWLCMSPVGWATWSMFTAMLFLGIRIALFEGLPYFLNPTLFWDMVEEFEISHLILVTNILDEMEKKGYIPIAERHQLRSLQYVISGGSVVKAKNYDFVYNQIKKDVIFTSTYGSTECAGTALVHDQTLKLHKCEIPSPALGIDCQCLDDEGNPVIGAVGEMVFCTSFPSLPLGLWGDNDRSLFKKAYCEKFPGKFTVGDLMIINPVTKGIIICGRSDETLKPGGCRFGSSEIYSIVDTFPEIDDSICVSQYSTQKIERAVLFLKMKSGYSFNESLVERLRATIAKELSVRHVPGMILEAKDIPCNINGKKLESVVKKVINKMPYNPETVVNPECLKYFTDVPEFSGF